MNRFESEAILRLLLVKSRAKVAALRIVAETAVKLVIGAIVATQGSPLVSHLLRHLPLR